MSDLKWLEDELLNLREEVQSLQRKIDYISMRLEEVDNEALAVHREVMSRYFRVTDSSYYMEQSEIFQVLKFELDNDLDLKEKCIKLGWEESSSSNTFYVSFWKYLPSVTGVRRVVKSKNDIRIYGLSSRNYSSLSSESSFNIC